MLNHHDTAMLDKEKRPIVAQAVDPSEEAAAAKLWAVYISEAEKYDKALVESWKSDMEGMLIFAGLFSASLTAFIIESYKTLTPDSGDSTVQLLAQISQQLAAAANGSTFHPPPPVHFSPPVTSLICNALWFISLGFSLACALIATLLEQWARNFLHKTEMRSAPVIRARIFSYLYYGLKRFSMHTVVDIIPLLLHASLLFFFAGLVAFLIPINLGIALLAAALLAIVSVVYSLLTLLPLRYLDCPYHTPLSGAFWRISRRIIKVWRSRRPVAAEDEQNTPDSSETMVEVMSHHAAMDSARSARDYRALVWTVKSLADDSELEPFVESIPDVLWGPDVRRYAYEDHIQRLIREPDLKLHSRIEGLLRSCDSGLLSVEAANRRRIACFQALWAIASLQTLDLTWKPLDFSHWSPYFAQIGTDDDHYYRPVETLMTWSTFCHVKNDLAELSKYLAHCEVDLKAGPTPNLQPVISRLDSLRSMLILPINTFLLNDRVQDYIRGDVAPASDIISAFARAIEDITTNTPHRILFAYLRRSARLASPPYHWARTQMAISLDGSASFYAFKDDLELSLEEVVYSNLHRLNITETTHWIDTTIHDLCSSWNPNEPTPLPGALIHYLNYRQSDGALRHLSFRNSMVYRLWSAFPMTLANGPSKSADLYVELHEEIGITEVLTALWRVSSLVEWGSSTALYESVLEGLSKISTSHITVSVIAMIEAKILDNLVYFGTEISSLRHPLLPAQTAIDVPEKWLSPETDPAINDLHADAIHGLVSDRVTEAKIALLGKFLEGSDSGIFPYKNTETVHKIGGFRPRAKVHESHQIRLANGIHRVARHHEPHGTQLLDTLILSPIFDIYAGLPDSRPVFLVQRPERTAWLDNSTARGQITETLSEYADKLSASYTSSSLLPRVEAILEGLDSPHASS
ncbi:hypothetical protein C8R44DRAFT_180249 [Mycena epipterygia]|nr:hypothetical protein C8R44DRAFT_180249 [Mycena epipterygia]